MTYYRTRRIVVLTIISLFLGGCAKDYKIVFFPKNDANDYSNYDKRLFSGEYLPSNSDQEIALAIYWKKPLGKNTYNDNNIFDEKKITVSVETTYNVNVLTDYLLYTSTTGVNSLILTFPPGQY